MSRILRSILVGIRMAVVEMRFHKLRSSLSIIGVMLGVASLVAMLTLVGGMDVFLNEKMGRWAGSIWFRRQREAPDDQKIQWSRSPGLRLTDGKYLEGESSAVETSYETIGRHGRFHVAGQREHGRVRGMEPKALAEDLENVVLDKGRWFTDDDYERGSRVCLISWEIEERVQRRMRSSDAQSLSLVGRPFEYHGVRFEIVGVFKPKDPNFNPWHLRRSVTVPLRAMQEYVTGMDPNPGAVRVSVTDAGRLKELAKAISIVMMGRHRGVEDFEYHTADWLERIGAMIRNAGTLMTTIALISLLVGGLSIMNVMLSSISERIREIGIRKALGAQKLQIFVQFMAETTTLSFVGGIAGVLLGNTTMFFREGIGAATEGAIVPTIDPVHILYVFCVIAGVGVLFGLYPAVKASRMSPVEALRYD